MLMQIEKEKGRKSRKPFPTNVALLTCLHATDLLLYVTLIRQNSDDQFDFLIYNWTI